MAVMNEFKSMCCKDCYRHYHMGYIEGQTAMIKSWDSILQGLVSPPPIVIPAGHPAAVKLIREQLRKELKKSMQQEQILCQLREGVRW